MVVDVRSLIALVLFMVTTVLANFFFKAAASDFGAMSLSSDTFMKALSTPYVWFGVIAYGVAAVAWFVSLSLVPLNIAISVSAFVYVLIILVAWLVFQEYVPLSRWFGIGMIIFGMIIIGRSV